MPGRLPPVGRWVMGALLIAIVATTAWAAGADAAPAQAEGECIEVLRWVYDPPAQITPPDAPTKYGRENSISVDPRFLTSYCFRGGKWMLTSDVFPYDSPDECIQIFYRPDEHGGDPPPDRVTPRDKIDDYGLIDSTGGLTGTEFIETYCRSGNEWGRNARADDQPTGSYTEWSRECVTIGPPIFDTPARTTRHPRELGNTDFQEFIETLGPEDLKTYCLHKDRDVWYQVDDYPLNEIIDDDSRLENPEQGLCVVLREVHAGHNADNLPEVIPGFGNPGDYGWYQEKNDYLEYNGGRDSINPKQAYCYVNGAWRRVDTLGDVCADSRESGQAAVESSGLPPDQCWGSFPSNNYDLGYDEGAWDHFDRRFYGWWTGFFFDLGKGGTQISLWAIGWAYSFDISDYDQFGLIIGEDYRNNLTHNPSFRLVEIAWLALFGWAGFNALRGKLSMAAGEIIVSIVLLGMSTVLMANRAAYMESTWDLMDQSSSALLVAGQGKNPATEDEGVETAVADVQKQIHGVFIEQPYDYLNWGHPVSGPCADARNQALALGPHGSDDFPREQMDEAGCNAEVDFNEEPNGTRLLGAILSMLASFVVSFVLLAVSLTVVVAKFGALLLFALAPFAALSAIFPAAGRRLAWVWLTTLVQMVVAVVGMSFLLSVLLLGVRRLLEETADVGLIERFFIVNLCVLVVAIGRRRLLASSQASAGRVADNLTNVRAGGGGAAWQGPTGSTGANLLGVDRGMRYAALGGAAAVAAGGRAVSQRLRERRAWHNTVKARRRGDRMAGVQAKTYYSDAPGGSNGPGPRGGYGDTGTPAGGGSGPRPGSGPGGGSGARPGAGDGGTRRTAGGPLSPRARAAAAAADGRKPEAAYWGGVDSAGNAYRAATARSTTPEGRQRAERNYSTSVRGHRDRYETATGRSAPMHPEPWAASPGAAAGGRAATGDGSARPARPAGGQEAAPQRSRRLVREVVVTETSASWRFPVKRMVDKGANAWTRRRGLREARDRDLL